MSLMMSLRIAMIGCDPSRAMDTTARLLQLLSSAESRSGTELGAELGISRAAVWKQIQQLGELGVEVESTRGKGYRLASPLELLDTEQILAALDAQTRDSVSALDVHVQIDSTNTHLMGLATQGASSGHVVAAEYQTAGRGRHGRNWVAPLGSSICLSVLWRYHDGATQLSGLSLAAGVVIVDALSELGVVDAGLKWPNDVLWKQQKLAGLLVEVAGDAAGPCYIVLGLGLNITLADQAQAEIGRPVTDLTTATGGQPVSRNQVAATLLNHLIPMLDSFERDSLKSYVDRWSRYNILQDQRVTLYSGNGETQGRVVGINDTGALVLDCDGERRTFNGGEVSLTNAEGIEVSGA
jgi:BirA family biotin operon repressor/biotin-[acetyl-CoA-carboxylase] ligase